MGDWDKYQHIIRDVEDDEKEYLSIISEIKKFDRNDSNFDVGFVESVQENLEDNGYITAKQYNALVNIYYSFRMGEINMNSE